MRKTVLVQLHSGKDYLLPNEEVIHVNERLVLRGWNYPMSRDLASDQEFFLLTSSSAIT